MKNTYLKGDQKQDLLWVIALVLLAIAISILYRPAFLLSTLLFFGLPSAFLVWRKPAHLYKATLASVLLGLVWGFCFDYIAEFNSAWSWASSTRLIVPIKLFGVVSLDILVWYFLWVFVTVLFYEHFVDRSSPKRLSRKFKWSLGIGILMIFTIVSLSKIFPLLFSFSYAYLVLGLLALVPFVYIVLKSPVLFPKVLEIVPFFAFLYFAFEMVALYTNLWSFPGHYIGQVIILGLSFPFEELIFWVLISSAVIGAYYEFVVDNGS